MDKTKTFIKMSEKAWEIQAIWHDKKLIGNLPSNNGFGLHYEKGYKGSWVYVPESINKGYHLLVDYEYCTSYEKSHIWLPLQGELQEMVKMYIPVLIKFEYLTSFFDSVFDNCKGKRSEITWEQLWLAFVMKEKYNKIWNGEDWELTNG